MGQYANTTQNSLTREKFQKFQQDLSFNDRVGTSKRSVFTLVYVKFLVGIVILTSLGIICCLLPSDILLKGLKAISFGLMAVYFSWEMVYFDSTTPGVYPPSPLSPQMIRKTSFYVIDTSYLFSVVNGMLFTVMRDLRNSDRPPILTNSFILMHKNTTNFTFVVRNVVKMVDGTCKVTKLGLLFADSIEPMKTSALKNKQPISYLLAPIGETSPISEQVAISKMFPKCG